MVRRKGTMIRTPSYLQFLVIMIVIVAMTIIHGGGVSSLTAFVTSGRGRSYDSKVYNMPAFCHQQSQQHSLCAKTRLHMSSASQQQPQQRQQHEEGEGNNENNPQNCDTNDKITIGSMRISEIKSELKDRNIDYSDCFDKESLVERLWNARNKDTENESHQESAPNGVSTDDTINNEISNDDTDDLLLLQQIKAMKVREIKEELSSYQIRWGNVFEKDDLVQKLFTAKKEMKSFSVTGLLKPGIVIDLTDQQVQMELSLDGVGGTKKQVSKPFLLDVYATWCGPCKIMAEQLQQAAQHDFISKNIRMAKMDSDKYPNLSSNFKIGGLPTVILFDANGVEMDRIEGAIMKDQIIEWIQSKTK